MYLSLCAHPLTCLQLYLHLKLCTRTHPDEEGLLHRELDLVAVNTLSVAAATGALVWLVAPSRSFGALHKASWQNMLHNLPHNVFDTSTPLRKYTLGSRAGGLAWYSPYLTCH